MTPSGREVWSHAGGLDTQRGAPARLSVRKQRRLAAAVVLIPLLATVAAIILACRQGLQMVSLVSLGVMYIAGMIGLTAGLHRYLAHRSFKTSRWFGALLTALGSINAQGSPLFWVSTHRRHHSMSDQPGDPFSPNLSGAGVGGRLRGVWHAYVGWMFADDPSDPAHFSRDLMSDRSLLRVSRLYPVWVFLGLALPSLASGLWTHSLAGAAQGLLWGGLVRMFLINQAIWSVGTYCHLFGTRPFPTEDQSTNNFWVALISFGEGLHNNHHAFPSSAISGLRWWEPDFGGWFLRAAQAVGLIWDVRIPSKQAILKARGV
jgi:stearoyl-CoA desaturase (Delta-9 desaturase)